MNSAPVWRTTSRHMPSKQHGEVVDEKLQNQDAGALRGTYTDSDETCCSGSRSTRKQRKGTQANKLLPPPILTDLAMGIEIREGSP